MKKLVQINLRSICRSLSFFLFASLLCSFLIGCATSPQRYGKINFCWTSDHHLPPEERILTLNSSPEVTAERITKWVNEKGGEIIEKKDDCDTIVKLQPEGEENFLAVQNIVKKEWIAYDENRFRKWEDGEWAKLQELSKNQTEFVNSLDNYGYYLKARLGKRDRTIQYQEQVGTSTFMHQTYIYTKNGPIPGMAIPVTSPKYETREKTAHFCSQIEFFVFRDEGSTKVYAVGAPFDEASSVKAAYGSNIGHSFWPMITGKDEAFLVKEAYIYLRDFEQEGKLNQLSEE